MLGSYGADGEIDNKLLKENINNIDGIYEPVGDNEVSSELFEILVDGYAFTIQKNGQIEGDTELATPDELPENTEGIEAGERVQLEESWQGESQAKTTVYAISDGKENTIPIPKGFYYVGGNLETGVVISDSSSDKDKGKDSLNGDVTKNLVGNQFVWIPCNEENYQKYDFGKQNCTWIQTVPEKEKEQIKKYGGFYVARYEAGTSKVTLTNGKKIGQELLEANNWKNESYAIKNITGASKPTSKANEIPYYGANAVTAKEMAQRMYNNSNYVSSDLITGTQWDVMLNYISDETNKSVENAKDPEKYLDLRANCDWGNYTNVPLNECNGKYCDMDKTTGSIITLWQENKNCTNKSKNYRLLTTGATEKVKRKNLYDVAGNLWEITQENVTAISDEGDIGFETNYVNRGGCFDNFCNANVNCCFRGYVSNDCEIHYGFRVILNIH